MAKTGFCFTLCCCLALPTTVSLHSSQVKLSMSVLPNEFELDYLIAAFTSFAQLPNLHIS